MDHFARNLQEAHNRHMDLAYFLNQRLDFVEYFHATTTASYEEVLRKIEAGEPPYADDRDPEYANEPPFMEEWQRANAAMTITGAACLDILQSTFHAYLDEYIEKIYSRTSQAVQLLGPRAI